MITTSLNYEIEKSKDGLPILRVDKDGKKIYIGSKYNMKSEIEKFLNAFDDAYSDDAVLLVYGFGTGEHIKFLRNRYSKNKILVFEPNLKLNEYISKNQILKDDNLKVISCEIDELAANIEGCINSINLNLSEINCFSNYNKVYIEEYSEFLVEIKRCFVNIIVDKNTRREYSRRWFETLMNNLPYIVEGVPAEVYENKYKDKPVVIVSAGPSLEKNIDELKKIDKDMLILTGGRTLRSLIDKGIDIDLLAVIDPNEVSYLLCKDYIEDLNKPLLFYEGSSDKVVAAHKGQKLFFTYNDFIKDIAEFDMKELKAGGSIAHVLTAYAIMLGCNPIIFIGQDLAYTNEKSHATIAQNRDGKKGFKELKRDDDIYIEGIDGNPIRTSLALNEYRRALEVMINDNKDNAMFINATEGGAKIKGTIQMTLKEAIEKYKAEKFVYFEPYDYKVNMKENALEALKESKETIEGMISSYKKALRYLDDLRVIYKTKNISKINSIIGKIDKIDEDVSANYGKIKLIDSLLYPIICETLTKNRNEESNKKDEILENTKFYSRLLNELQFAIKYINKAIIKLQ